MEVNCLLRLTNQGTSTSSLHFVKSIPIGTCDGRPSLRRFSFATDDVGTLCVVDFDTLHVTNSTWINLVVKREQLGGVPERAAPSSKKEEGPLPEMLISLFFEIEITGKATRPGAAAGLHIPPVAMSSHQRPGWHYY